MPVPGALTVYAVDTLLAERPRTWNYRRLGLSDSGLDGGSMISKREGCTLCNPRWTNAVAR